MPGTCLKEERVNIKLLFAGSYYLGSSRLLYKQAGPDDLENREVYRSYLVYKPLVYSTGYSSVYTMHHLNLEKKKARLV